MHTQNANIAINFFTVIMKKKLFSIAASMLVAGAINAQEGTVGEYSGNYLSNYENCDCLYDTVYSLWYTKNIDKSGLINGGAWFVPIKEQIEKWETHASEQYTISWDEEKEALRVDFNNQLQSDGMNYQDLSLMFSEWLENEIDNNPFNFGGPTVGGSIYSFNGEPIKIYMNVMTSDDLNLRVDLGDVNGRLSNTVSPRNEVFAENQFNIYEFSFARDGHTIDEPIIDGPDVNSVVAFSDSWSGDFNGIDNGRYSFDTEPFFGRAGYNGAVDLDPDLISKVSFTLDDGMQGNLNDQKTIWIRSIQLGGDQAIFKGEEGKVYDNSTAETGGETPAPEFLADGTEGVYLGEYLSNYEECGCYKDLVYSHWYTKNIDFSNRVTGEWDIPIKELTEKWETNAPEQYTISWDDSKEALKIDFVNQLPDGGMNYADLSLKWADLIGGAEGTTPFNNNGPVLTGPIYSFGNNPINIQAEILVDQDLNFRIDLGDGNGRLSNRISPRNEVFSDTDFQPYFFSFSDTTMSDGPDVNQVGIFADAYSGDFLGVPNGRYDMSEPLYGNAGNEAAILLDPNLITKVSLTIDDGTQGMLDEAKTIWIKSITLGVGNEDGTSDSDEDNQEDNDNEKQNNKPFIVRAVNGGIIANQFVEVYDIYAQLIGSGQGKIECPQGLVIVVAENGKTKMVYVK